MKTILFVSYIVKCIRYILRNGLSNIISLIKYKLLFTIFDYLERKLHYSIIVKDKNIYARRAHQCLVI